jgi:hypothetical protein
MTTFAPAAPAYRRVTGTPTWRAISRRHRVRLVETLEWISDRLRQKGEHGGPATHATIRVFRALLFRFANTDTGVCLPGYKALAEAARTCERTAERAVQRLEALGVLWIHPRHAVWIAPDGAWFRIGHSWVTRAHEERRPVRAGFRHPMCPVREAASLPLVQARWG